MRTRLLRLVLRSPAHLTVSRRFLLLRALGGTPVTPPVPLRYATHEGVHVVLGAAGASWWRALSTAEDTAAEVRFKGRSTVMAARLAQGEVLDEAVLRYLQKYPGEWRALGIDAGAEPDDVQAAARGSAVVLLTPAG